ncbi:glycerol-3-phosphate dehydrogenase [Pelagibacteraceae bacterium]|nr:glycerol-3-phosphate dehydrogenase [Pelagibacteraceae bacterium]
MSNILIFGAGSMGTAFSFPCSDNNINVSIVGTHLENKFIEDINLKNMHPTLGCEIPKNVKFKKFNKLGDEMNKKVDLIVLAVVSKGIEWAANELSKYLKKNIPILILTKGLSLNNNKYEVLAHKLERILKKNGIKKTTICAAGGPCLAKGLANRVHTSVIFASADIKVAKDLALLISTNYYHIFTSNDVIGVEVCAAIKNIFSMIIGASEGLCTSNNSKEIKKNNYLNTAASLIQQSINEMVIFTEALKGKKETVVGLAGIGDLYVSADGGRNSKMGKFLGEGLTFQDAKKDKMPFETIEGADLVLEIGKKVKKDFDVKKLPLMFSIINTICDEKPLSVDWNYFLK